MEGCGCITIHSRSNACAGAKAAGGGIVVPRDGCGDSTGGAVRGHGAGKPNQDVLSTPGARRYSLRLTKEGDGQLGSAFKDVSVPPLPSRLISPSSSSSARSDHTPPRRFSLRLSSESGFGSGFFGSDLQLQEPRQIPKESPIRVLQEEPPQPPPLPPRRSVEGEERGRSIDEARGNLAESASGPSREALRAARK